MKIRRQRGGGGGPQTVNEWLHNATDLYNKITDLDTLKQLKFTQFKNPSLSLDAIPESTTFNNAAALYQSPDLSTIETSNGVRENIRNVAISLYQVFINMYEQIKSVDPRGIDTIGSFVQASSGPQTNEFDILKKFEEVLLRSAKGLGYEVNEREGFDIKYPFFTFALLMNAPNGTPKPLLGAVDPLVPAAEAVIPAVPEALTI